MARYRVSIYSHAQVTFCHSLAKVLHCFHALISRFDVVHYSSLQVSCFDLEIEFLSTTLIVQLEICVVHFLNRAEICKFHWLVHYAIEQSLEHIGVSYGVQTFLTLHKIFCEVLELGILGS